MPCAPIEEAAMLVSVHTLLIRNCRTYLELRIVVLSMEQVYYPRQPALLFYRLFGLLCSSLNRAAWVPLRLLNAFSDKNLQYLQYAFEVLDGGDRRLVSHQTPCNFTSDCSSGRIRLGVEERDVVW